MANHGPTLPAERRLYDRAGHQLDPRKLQSIRESLPEVSKGQCRSCKKWYDDLGDGLCCDCWDSTLNTQDAARMRKVRGTDRGA